MLGKTTDQIRSERENVVKDLESRGYEVLDSIFTEEPPKNSQQGAWYLGESIKLLSTADLVYFMKGWKYARGCRLEHSVADAYEIPIMEE
jgi:hypothetical protein